MRVETARVEQRIEIEVEACGVQSPGGPEAASTAQARTAGTPSTAGAEAAGWPAGTAAEAINLAGGRDLGAALLSLDAAISAAALDPEALLAALEVGRRDEQSVSEGGRIRDAAADEKRASRARQHAMAAARKTSGFLGLGKVLGKLLKVVAAIAATAATVVTGGAGAPLAIAGMALMLGAKDIAKALAAAGLISKDDVAKMTLALQVLGTALSLGTGLAAGAASTAAGGVQGTAAGVKASTVAAQKLAKVAETVGEITEAVGALNQGAMAALRHVKSGHERTGARAGFRAQGARDRIDAGAEALRELMEAFVRVQSLLAGMREATAEARLASVRCPA
jgi:hypothetical protein